MLRISIGSCMLRLRPSIGSCMLRLRLCFRGSGEEPMLSLSMLVLDHPQLGMLIFAMP